MTLLLFALLALTLAACTDRVEPVRVPSPALTHIDRPGANTTVTGSVEVSGWALHPQGAVQAVELLLDDQVVGAAVYGHERADICDQHRGRAGCPNVGWRGTIDLATAAPGERQLTVRVTGPFGDRTETPPRPILIAAPTP